jgi:murein DD-endopeptidase MepM/ murein hydrolase activator NlpD
MALQSQAAGSQQVAGSSRNYPNYKPDFSPRKGKLSRLRVLSLVLTNGLITSYNRRVGARNHVNGQPYFIVVVAHSLHGRLRRLHVPQSAFYVVLALAMVGFVSVAGAAASYLRMVSKASQINALRAEVDVLRNRYQRLQSEHQQGQQQLASLQVLASEVTTAFGIRRLLEGPADISYEGRLAPTLRESISAYNFLKSSSMSSFYRGSLSGSARGMMRIQDTPSIWPVEGEIVSRFGMRLDPFDGQGAFHAGIDISAPTGRPIHASADGVVRYADWMSGYGRIVVIDHGVEFESAYGHMDSFSVVAGQVVRRGDIIGTVGNTGRSTGPHLHYEVRIHGTPANPYLYMKQNNWAKTEVRDLPF